MESKRITDDQDLQIALQIRKEVFVHEQGVPLEIEIDEYDTLDGQCEHVLVYYNGEPVGTGRFRIIDGLAKAERICVLKPYRKFGLGRKVLDALEEIAIEKGFSQIRLHGQTHVEGFYNKLGYQTLSDVFLEHDIPHVLMIKDLTAK